VSFSARKPHRVRLSRRASLALLALSACYMRDPTPLYPQLGPSGGYAPPDFDKASACRSWQWASSDAEANKHASFPDRVPAACFAEVTYGDGGEITSIGPVAESCAYPNATAADALLARAAKYERVARGNFSGKLPLELACELPAGVRKRAAAANAHTLRSFAASIDVGSERYPYAVAGTFGFGHADQNQSRLLGWLPGDDCVELDDAQHRMLRVSGAAVHGRLIEAFMLGHLAVCDGGVPPDRVLYDPCADHTHTNVRNTGAIMNGFGARTAYLVTDDFIQSDYMQDFAWFESIGGSIDQRALRDWGYLVGSWRQASRGISAGFWYTPYRFWAEPAAGLGSFSCVGDVALDR
jgi:hypothetical protein